jgi:hypothetical protein
VDELLSSGNILAVAALAAGGLALLKKHWYRWAQVLFTVAMLLANAKVLRWTYTSDFGLKTRLIFGCVGIVGLTVAYLWVFLQIQREIKEAASEAKTLAPVFARLTDFERAVLRQVVLLGRSTKVLNALEPALVSIEEKTGFITRTFIGHYELSRDIKEPLQALLANDSRSSLLSLEPGVGLTVTVKSEGRDLRTFRNNEITGDEGRALEGFEIRFDPPIDGLSIEYNGHFEVMGSVPYVTEGKFLRAGDAWQLEGFAIRLTGSNADNYDVFYRSNAPKFGDYDECCNGQFCGSAGRRRSLDTMIVRVALRAL